MLVGPLLSIGPTSLFSRGDAGERLSTATYPEAVILTPAACTPTLIAETGTHDVARGG
jgi:hypothetical protein